MAATMKVDIDLYSETLRDGDTIFFKDGTHQRVVKHKKGSHIVTFENGKQYDLYVLEHKISFVLATFDKNGRHTLEYISAAALLAVRYLTTNCKYRAYLDVVKAFLIGDEDHYISDYCQQSALFGILRNDNVTSDEIRLGLISYVTLGYIKHKAGKHKKIYYYTRKDNKRWHVDYVWYFCYGSNMCFERFMCYITGKRNDKYLIKEGKPCEDQSPILATISIKIPYEMYFGNSSKTWKNGGVCFIKPTKDPNKHSFARGYLITKKQYDHVREREGTSPDWYGEEIVLDMQGGVPCKTFTSKVEHQYNAPSGLYLSVVEKGLMEWGLSYIKARQYLYCKTHNQK